MKEKGKKKKSNAGKVLGKNVKFYRESQDKTLKDLAMESQLSLTHLSDVENNKTEPSLDVAYRISRSLKIDLGKLVTELREK